MTDDNSKPMNPERRKLFGKILAGGAAFAAGTTILSTEEQVLAEKLAEEAKKNGAKDVEVDALSGASRTHTNWGKLSDLKKPMTKATIKGIDFSRMMIGGNLIGGWAHARDLLYASDLVKAYHTREKIVATFKMAEACGINTYNGNNSHIGMLNDYWEKNDGSLNFIADCDSIDVAKSVIDKGATAAYHHGGVADTLVANGKVDVLGKFVDAIRKEGVPVGIGGHKLETISACVDAKIEPDFWMKTLHHDNYWSCLPDKPYKDNVFCWESGKVIEYMNSLKQPWIAFKVLAAGAIYPSDGFRYAWEGGADFINVGMYDFQIVDDVNICMGILDSELKRKRAWCFT
ncbi:MAG: hypothetical protein LBN39_04195 [Planctomycetaceae bacterium]|jgi:hypothetical protein|nr:hypothetical protein [Planctomycetaceae bacterium]